MAKECIQELTKSISSTSDRLMLALAQLDPEIVENFQKVSATEKVDFYQWFSKHYANRLTTLPNLFKSK